MQGPPGPLTLINGREVLYFGGTSYFGLHGHPEVIKASESALKKYGINSATTRNGFGTTPLMLDLEKKAAAFFDTENATCLASGFLSSMAGLQSLQQFKPFNVVFIDAFAHYSNFDAAYATRKPVVPFTHMNPQDLESKIKKHLKAGHRPLLVTDGIFPVFGEIAPLPAYLSILLTYDGIIWVDDAHGTGVLGEKGKGCLEYHHIAPGKIFMGSTFSKAIGGFGGIIPGPDEYIKVVQKMPVQLGTSPAPTPVVAANLKGLEILMEHPEMRTKLRHNVHRLKNGLKTLGIEVDDTPVPITAWSLKNEAGMKQVQKRLMDCGISIQYTHYTGAPKQGVLRVVVFSTHSEAQIDRLISELKELI